MATFYLIHVSFGFRLSRLLYTYTGALVRSAFCPKKVDLTIGLTLHPGYKSVQMHIKKPILLL